MVAHTGASEIDYGVEAADGAKIALVYLSPRRIPPDHARVARGRAGPHEAHDFVTSLTQCFDERRADKARRARYADAHVSYQSDSIMPASWSGIDRWAPCPALCSSRLAMIGFNRASLSQSSR